VTGEQTKTNEATFRLKAKFVARLAEAEVGPAPPLAWLNAHLVVSAAPPFREVLHVYVARVSSSAAVGLTDYSLVDMLGLW
jgi:hypothetical protein